MMINIKYEKRLYFKRAKKDGTAACKAAYLGSIPGLASK